jgi:hypothetical protein
VRYRIRTLLFLVAVTAPPIYAGCEGWKAGCLVPVVVAWAAMLAAPLLMLGLSTRFTYTEQMRERVIAGLGSIVILGYLCSIFLSMLIIGFCQNFPTLRPLP